MRYTLFIALLILPSIAMGEASPPRDKMQLKLEANLHFPKSQSDQKIARSTHPMPIDEATLLLDYKQFGKVQAAMQQLVLEKPNNEAAWKLLSQAYTELHQPQQASTAWHAYQQLHQTPRWHAKLMLSTFSDSNVVAAPDRLQLAAVNQGDVGAKAALQLYGEWLQDEWGRSQVILSWQDMLYQDFNRFAVRQLGITLNQSIQLKSDQLIQMQAHAETLYLGKAFLNDTWKGSIGHTWFYDSHQISLRGELGRHVFSPTFADFTGYFWKITPALTWQHDNLSLQPFFSLGSEHASRVEESYLSQQLGLKAEQLAWQQGSGENINIQLNTHLTNNRYQVVDHRPFLIQPMQRQDQQLHIETALSWQLPRQWHERTWHEIWGVKSGWMRSRSNIDPFVITPSRARSWSHWWIDFSVTWER